MTVTDFLLFTDHALMRLYTRFGFGRENLKDLMFESTSYSFKEGLVFAPTIRMKKRLLRNPDITFYNVDRYNLCMVVSGNVVLTTISINGRYDEW